MQRWEEKQAKLNIEKLGFEQILELRNDPLNVTQHPDVSLRIKMNCISKKRSSNRVNPNNLRLKFALNPIMLVGSLQTVSRRLLSTTAPQNNMKLQAGLDRLYQDIEKLKSKLTRIVVLSCVQCVLQNNMLKKLLLDFAYIYANSRYRFFFLSFLFSFSFF